jgi:hypothetical protein
MKDLAGFLFLVLPVVKGKNQSTGTQNRSASYLQ